MDHIYISDGSFARFLDDGLLETSTHRVSLCIMSQLGQTSKQILFSMKLWLIL